MSQLAFILLFFFYWNLLTGGNDKLPEATSPPAATAPASTNLSDEEYDRMMRENRRRNRNILQDKLVYYQEGADLYGRDFIPEAYIAWDPREVRGHILLKEEPVAGDPTTSILTVTIKDVVRDVVVAENTFKVTTENDVPGAIFVGYSNPELVMEWIEPIWAAYIEDLDYDELVSGHRNGKKLTDNKIACFDVDAQIYIQRYVPEDLMARKAAEVKAVVQIDRNINGDREEAKITMIVYEDGNPVSKDGLLQSDPGMELDDALITQWILDTWNEYWDTIA